MKNFFQNTKGFTLMEVMVAVSIFAIVVTVGIASLLTINDSYRKSQTDRQAIDSLTFVLESMSRRIRTAQSWDPSLSYNGGSTSSFSFVDQDGLTVIYSWDQAGKGILMEIVDPDGTAAVSTGIYEMTPDAVSITDVNPDGSTNPGGGLSFYPMTSPNGQSYVQINVGGYVTNARQVSNFAFQTGVSKRGLDTQ